MKCEHELFSSSHQGCDNDARYTTAEGGRLCSLHAMVCGRPHVRDMDLPEVLTRLETLLDTLDGQLVTAGYGIRVELRQLISSKPVIKGDLS